MLGKSQGCVIIRFVQKLNFGINTSLLRIRYCLTQKVHQKLKHTNNSFCFESLQKKSHLTRRPEIHTPLATYAYLYQKVSVYICLYINTHTCVYKHSINIYSEALTF